MTQCICSSWEGTCTLRDEGDTSTFKDSPVGWDSEGNCVVEDDECPEDSCQYFEDQDQDWEGED